MGCTSLAWHPRAKVLAAGWEDGAITFCVPQTGGGSPERTMTSTGTGSHERDTRALGPPEASEGNREGHGTRSELDLLGSLQAFWNLREAIRIIGKPQGTSRTDMHTYMP